MNPLCVSFLFFDGDVIVVRVTRREKKGFHTKYGQLTEPQKGHGERKENISCVHLEVSGAHMKCFFFTLSRLVLPHW